MYSEDDLPNASDVYGQSKALGEVLDATHTITLRTSIIGYELGTQYGLLEWFLAQTGTIKGYQRAIFTGFTTVELANIIQQYVLPNDKLHGLYHVAANPISKYDLLQLAKQIYKRDITIEADEQVVVDRSLDATRFNTVHRIYIPPSWQAMLQAYADYGRA